MPCPHDSAEATFITAGTCIPDGACVQVGQCCDEILVRDSKDPGGPVLRFTAAEWDAFVAGAKAGDFDPAT